MFRTSLPFAVTLLLSLLTSCQQEDLASFGPANPSALNRTVSRDIVIPDTVIVTNADSIIVGNMNPTPDPADSLGLTGSLAVAPGFAYGADPSWLTEMESFHKNFYNNSGVQQDLFTVLKGKGINAIRLRLWVNPAKGWCNTRDVLAKALRAKAAGMRILVDIHYSDVWADPGNQAKPVAWAGQNVSALYTSVYNFTLNTMRLLKSNGVAPTWVQVGNETNDGMLWPEGHASLSPTNFQQFAYMINSGRNAVKAVFPYAKVIVHIANGNDNTKARWLFDGLRTYGANWDICGFSVYPTASNWATNNTQVAANLRDMAARYGKQVMVCEAGMSVADAGPCKSFLLDLISKTQAVPGGLGVFYWEPESYGNWYQYGKGAFSDNGQPTIAMDAFMH